MPAEPIPSPDQIKEALRVLHLAKGGEEKPFTWSPKSVSSYYNVKYATIVAKYLHNFISTNQESIVLSPKELMIGRRSLLVMFHQGLLYLRERMEVTDDPRYPQGKWLWVRQHVKVSKHIQGIKLSVKHLDYMENPIPEVPEQDTGNWLSELYEFVEQAPDGKFFERDVGISDAEIYTVRNLLADIKNIHVFRLTHRGIKVGKFNLDEAKKEAP